MWVNFKLIDVKKEAAYKKEQFKLDGILLQGIRFNNQIAYEYQNKEIVDSEVFDENGDAFHLSELVNDRTLVFRYSHLACNQCVDSILSIINASSFRECIILAEYDNPQSLGAFYRTNQPIYPVFNCRDDLIAFDTLNIPYAFIIDSSMRISSLFIPVKEDMHYSRDCFNSLKKNLEDW